MTLRLNGSTSGYVEIDAPAVAGTSALTLPTGTGTLATQASVGLVKIVDQSFTAASSVSVNNCFTSAYDTYRILITSTQTNANNLFIRLRLSGSDASASSYNYYQWRGAGSTSISAPQTSQTAQQIDAVGGVGKKFVELAVFDPALSVNTGFNILSGNVSDPGVGLFSGQYSVASAYDGFTIYPTTGTITGTVRVYGYQN